MLRDRGAARARARSLLLTALTLAVHATAALAAPAAEDPREAIERFVQRSTADWPNQPQTRLVHTGRMVLPPCLKHEVFLPPGAALGGRTTLGLRCQSPEAWTRFVSIDVSIEGRYFAATRTIEAGQPVNATDFTARSGDLTRLPRSVITEAAELDGVMASNRIAAGTPLRRDLVRPVVVIRQGQKVRVVARGQGYTISLEAQALNHAAAGGSVQVKTTDGRLLQGVAQPDGRVELAQ